MTTTFVILALALFCAGFIIGRITYPNVSNLLNSFGSDIKMELSKLHSKVDNVAEKADTIKTQVTDTANKVETAVNNAVTTATTTIENDVNQVKTEANKI